MQLLLVQHGEAASEAVDPARALTPEGALAVERTAAWLASRGVRVDKICHSGKLRAEQTASILAEHLGAVNTLMSVQGMAPKDDVAAFAKTLDLATGSTMLVGHLPHLARLAGYLLAGDGAKAPVSFVNAGVVCLDWDGQSWALQWAIVPELAREV